jgi:antirestriction protein ArdC
MKKSVAEIITEQIINRLEEGNIPWRKPWNGEAHAPRNLVTGKPYRGINAFLLACSGFSSPYFLTFKQVQEKGGQVKEGARSFPVVFWSMVTAEDRETGDEKSIPFMRYYRVFSVEQTTLPVPELPQVEREFNPIEEAERIVDEMPMRPEIRTGEAKAYYVPLYDYINMPRKGLFHSDAEFYNSLFHELGHSSGHISRLARKGVMESTYFGSHDYSKEELIAEMTAAFLCGECGIACQTIDNSAAYIRGWIKTLKSRDNKNLVITAASAAQKAYDFILNRRPEEIKDAA